MQFSSAFMCHVSCPLVPTFSGFTLLVFWRGFVVVFRGCFEDFVLVFFFNLFFFEGGVTIISFVKLKQV